MKKNKNLKMLLITSKDVIEENINKGAVNIYVRLLQNFQRYDLKNINAFKENSLTNGQMRLDLSIITMAEKAQDYFLAKKVVNVFSKNPKQVIVGSVTDIKESKEDYNHYIDIMENKVKIAFEKMHTIYLEAKEEVER